MGEKVRYDGKHKFAELEKYFAPEHYQLMPICPEVKIGMSIPRPPIQIRIIDNKRRLVQVDKHAIDYTPQMKLWFNDNQEKFAQFAGFILKSKSPSCGNKTTPHFQTNNEFDLADGLFVQLLKQMNSHQPIIDEISIKNKTHRTNFILNLKPKKN